MKIKILALAFTLVFTASITATSFAQILNTPISIVLVDDDDDKDKNKTKNSKDAKVKSDCKSKKSCCSHSKLKDTSCKDKKVEDKKSDKDKK